MAEVKWIKVVTELFDDDKIILIQNMKQGDSILLIWIQLLCLAGKQNNRGRFELNGIPCSVEMLATLLRRPISLVRTAIDAFLKFGMLAVDSDALVIANWSKHQRLEGLEKSKEQSRKRVENYRNKQQQSNADVTQCNVTSNADVTQCNVTSNATSNADVTQCNATSNVTVTQCNADRIRIRIRDKDTEEESKEIPKKSDSALEREFEDVWVAYPRKVGKKPALASYLRARRDGATFEEIKAGAERFANKVRAENVDLQFVPHGSTWFQQARWEDWEGGNGSNDESDNTTGNSEDSIFRVGQYL